MATRTRAASANAATPATKAAAQPVRRKKAEPRPYHHGHLRDSLLDAAETLLARHGAHGVTMRDAARLAGVSHAAPYHHFPSLDDLLAAVAERGFVQLGDAVAQVMAAGDARQRLLGVAQTYVACASAHPARFRLMFGPLLATKDDRPALKAAAERAFGFVLSAASAKDAEHSASLALAGWSLAHGLSHLLIDGALGKLSPGPKNPAKLARKLAEHLLA